MPQLSNPSFGPIPGTNLLSEHGEDADDEVARARQSEHVLVRPGTVARVVVDQVDEHNVEDDAAEVEEQIAVSMQDVERAVFDAMLREREVEFLDAELKVSVGVQVTSTQQKN